MPRRNTQTRNRLVVASAEWIDFQVNRIWKTSKHGSVYLNIAGYNMAIIQDHNEPGTWRYRLKDRNGVERPWSRKYRSVGEAKRPAIEELAGMLRSQMAW